MYSVTSQLSRLFRVSNSREPELRLQHRIGQRESDSPLVLVCYRGRDTSTVQALSNETANGEVKQVWCGDDSSAVGSLAGVKKWWEYLQVKGPDFGYCPKPVKTILLIKQNSLMHPTQKLFKDDRIKITDQGERHLAWISNWDGIIQGTIP